MSDAGLLRTELCGLSLRTPLVLLSGCVGFGQEYTRVAGFSHRDVGMVVLKGTTLEPRLGNAPHRLAETPGGMLNAIGLQNPGARAVVRDILPRLDFSETLFAANVSGATVEEYAEVTRIFDDSPVAAIELNISCPNVKAGGVQFGNDPEMSARVVEACRRMTRKPLITKLSPNQTDIAENARRCIEAGTDAFAAINTLQGMAIDLAQPQAGAGQPPGRSVRAGHQADRAAQGASGVRGGGAARRADHRPGRGRLRRRCARVPAGRGERGRRRHGAVLRPADLSDINAGIADYLRRHDHATSARWSAR